MLTVISAYLIFQSLVNTSVKNILEKKGKTILIPMIFWNLLVMAPIFTIQFFNISNHEFSTSLYPFEFMSWANALTGIFGSPANYPLNFLRDLFALCLLIPIFRLLLNHFPYLGAAVIIAVYYFNLDGSFILRNSMLVSFYLGALAATQRWDVTYLDRYAHILLVSFILFCSIVVIFDIENREPLRFVAPLMLWPAMSLIVESKFGNLLNRYSFASFFTFLAHGPMLLVLWFIYKSKLSFIPYPAFWFFAPVIIVISCVVITSIAKKNPARLNFIIFGGR